MNVTGAAVVGCSIGVAGVHGVAEDGGSENTSRRSSAGHSSPSLSALNPTAIKDSTVSRAELMSLKNDTFLASLADDVRTGDNLIFAR